MKHLKITVIAMSLALFTTTSLASPIWISTNHTLTKTQQRLLTIKTVTSQPYQATFTVENFVGTSLIAPCSDLHSTGVSQPFFDEIKNASSNVTSEDLVEEFGSNNTCVKTEITMMPSGHVYSTGNLQTLWDINASTYTAVIPDEITIDLNNQ